MHKWRLHIGLALLLIAATITVFRAVPSHDFVAWDDNILIYENPLINPQTELQPVQFWTRPYKELYMPLTYHAWALLGRATQLDTARLTPNKGYSVLDPRAFHILNLALHVLNVLLVFAILGLLLRSDGLQTTSALAAGAGALLFAVHPFQVESVAWASELKGVFSAFFALLAIWQYLCFARSEAGKRANAHYGLATLCFALSLLAKPSAVAVPLVVCVLELWILKRPARRVATALAIWVLMAVGAVIIARSVQPTGSVTSLLWWRPFIAGDALAFYIYKFLVPLNLGVHYGRTPTYVMQHTWGYLTWLIPLCLIFIAWRLRHRAPHLVAAGGIFVAALLPVLGLVPFIFQAQSTVADRYMYLAMLGPALGLAWVMQRFVVEKQKGYIFPGFCVVWMLWLGWLSHVQTGYWYQSSTLFAHALRVNPNSWPAHTNMGYLLATEGRPQEALVHYREALRINPQFPEAHTNTALILAEGGRVQEALGHYQAALRVAPGFPEAHNGIGFLLAEQGRLEEAIAHFREALRTDPYYVGAYVNLANVMAQQGHTENALKYYRDALRIKPSLIEAHNNLGLLLARTGDLEGAKTQYEEALRIKPNDAEAHNNLGLALARQGAIDEATSRFRQALEHDPKYVEAHYNLGVALAMQRQMPEAIAQWKKALSFDPNYAPAKSALNSIPSGAAPKR